MSSATNSQDSHIVTFFTQLFTLNLSSPPRPRDFPCVVKVSETSFTYVNAPEDEELTESFKQAEAVFTELLASGEYSALGEAFTEMMNTLLYLHCLLYEKVDRQQRQEWSNNELSGFQRRVGNYLVQVRSKVQEVKSGSEGKGTVEEDATSITASVGQQSWASGDLVFRQES
ncbi:hypothetical protein M231_04614 [Tremella mesenterica]|uniref:Uncharacterized protein n=1 Tax=Tremella mesenterica TaxID=5217 RepID=A0A4Q1BK66_TREME|nr:hypothetical protein M231_04614 [Tremella mesenterica]